MSPETVRNGLLEIADLYPTLRGLLEKPLRGDVKVGTQWIEVLKDCNEYYFKEVCGEYADCVKPLPQPIDQLVFEIRSETNDRYARDLDRHTQHVKYHQKRQSTKEPTLFMRALRASWQLGLDKRDGKINETQRLVRTQELADWEKGGDQPEWMD